MVAGQLKRPTRIAVEEVIGAIPVDLKVVEGLLVVGNDGGVLGANALWQLPTGRFEVQHDQTQPHQFCSLDTDTSSACYSVFGAELPQTRLKAKGTLSCNDAAFWRRLRMVSRYACSCAICVC